MVMDLGPHWMGESGYVTMATRHDPVHHHRNPQCTKQSLRTGTTPTLDTEPSCRFQGRPGVMLLTREAEWAAWFCCIALLCCT